MGNERRFAQKFQAKFEFYVVSLTFTLLALTIQTAKFGRSTVEDVVELAGWFALLVAGIFGLWRLEWDPPNRLQIERRNKLKSQRDNIAKGITRGAREMVYQDSGERVKVDTALAEHDAALKTEDEKLESRKRTDMFKYKWARLAFVVGVCAIVLSRSIGAAFGLFGYALL